MRIVQNSFVAGEIAPELYGRSDLQTYYHSAAEIENFLVKKTGGVVKRAGTELLWHITGGTATSYRAFPFFYDRTHYAIILFYVKQNNSTLFYRVLVPDESVGKEQSTEITTLLSGQELSAFRIKQIGDTIFFSRRGARAFSGKLDFDKRTINWSALREEISVEAPPEMTIEAVDFETEEDKGYYATEREYALFGIKSGVLSEPSEKVVTTYLPWVAGAKVNISFTPNWYNHDSYQLALKQGGVYGVISTFYPNTKTSKITDVNWDPTGCFIDNISIGDATYSVGIPTFSWKQNPDTITKNSNNLDYNPTAVAVNNTYLSGTHISSTSPILGIKVWFGAILQTTDTTQTAKIGTTGKTTITLYSVDEADVATEIATWSEINASYSESEQTLVVSNPQLSSTAKYRLKITNDTSNYVIVRGVVFLSDTETQKFVDTNILAGETTGIQEPLHVGDAGMDVGLVDIWEQRLVLASSTSLPFSLWFSTVGDIKNFYANRPQTSADAFSVSIPAVTSTKILHMMTARWFLLFTEGGEYCVDSVGNSGFGFDTITIKKTSAVGASEDVEPVLAESKVLFVSADGRKVYDMSYSLEQDVVMPTCRSDYVPHLTESDPIIKIVHTQSPDPVLWCMTKSGRLLSMTYLPENKVFAWARHTLGYDKLKLVDIMSPTTISVGNDVLTTSDVILVFTHEAHPEDVYIERMRANIATSIPSDEQAQTCDHLGYNAADYPDGVDPATPVVGRIVTIPTQMGDSNTLGIEKNIKDMVLHVRRTGKLKARPYVENGTKLQEAETLYQKADLYPTAPEGHTSLFSGIIKLLPRAFINPYGQVEIISDDGLPCEIMAIVCNIELGLDEQERS